MKRCPQCKQIFADEIKFCLRDGNQLAPLPVVSEEKINIQPSAQAAQITQPDRQGVNPLFAYLSAALFALLIGVAVFIWMKADSNASSIVKNETITNDIGEIKGKQNTEAVNYSETNNRSESNESGVINLPVNTVRTQPPSAEASVVRSEVKAALDGWVQASINRNFEDQMKYYADRLETYYRKNNVGVSFVRSDKKKFFERFSVVDVSVSNLKIDVNSASGQVQTIFDKAFDSSGDTAHINGAVQSQLRWAKDNGIWKIIGEKDLQVYRVNK